MDQPVWDGLLQDILREWNKAEKSIKLAEQLDNRVAIAAINELRYAGRRLVEALGEAQVVASEKRTALLNDALFFCHRARHDAIDAATNKMIGDLDQAERILGPETILEFFPKITELIYKLNKIRENVALSREQRDQRDFIYDFIEKSSEEEGGVFELFYEFRGSEGRIKAAAARRESRQRINNIFGWLGAVGFFVGLTGIYLTIWGVPDWLRALLPLRTP